MSGSFMGNVSCDIVAISTNKQRSKNNVSEQSLRSGSCCWTLMRTRMRDTLLEPSLRAGLPYTTTIYVSIIKEKNK